MEARTELKSSALHTDHRAAGRPPVSLARLTGPGLARASGSAPSATPRIPQPRCRVIKKWIDERTYGGERLVQSACPR